MTDVAEGLELSGHGLVERISEGAFCEVWRGENLENGQSVAVKLALDDVGRRMIAAEVEIAGLLAEARETGVVPVWHHGEEPVAHLVMPWIDQGSLRDELDGLDGWRRRADVLRRFIELVGAMGRIHTKHGLIHGDLKPENVLVGGEYMPYGDGSPWSFRERPGAIPSRLSSRRLALTDFGLGREIQEARRGQSLCHSMQSADGLIGGTMAYLAPELIKGAAPSCRGDVYALGVMLHEVLLGRRPDKALGAESLRPLLPDPVIEVLLKALAFDPRERYSGALSMWGELKDISALTASGPMHWARLTGRYLQAALAAFFITLRYASVLVLLASYAWLLLLGVTEHPVVWLSFLPILGFHYFVRWEGVETSKEAPLRRSGEVVSRQ